MQVEFVEVGRSKKSWCEEMVKLTHGALEKSVRQHGALMSRGIDFDMDDDNTGTIYSGLHPVGRFRITPAIAKAEELQA